jgi:hypothetical protein
MAHDTTRHTTIRRQLNSSKSAPKAPLSPKSKKSTPDKDGAVPIDPEEFFDVRCRPPVSIEIHLCLRN